MSAEGESLRVEVARDFATLDAHAEAWDLLAAASPPCRPTLGHAWVRAFLSHRLDARDTWSCALGWRGDRLVGVLPLRRRGAHLYTLCDDHTPSGDAVLSVDAQPVDIDALLHAHGSFRSARFEGVVPDSPTHAWLVNGPSGRHVLHRAHVMTGARIDATRPYEEILAQLSSNARSKLRKGARLLEAAGTTAFQVRDTAEALQDFLDLERRSWKGAQGTALAQDEGLCAFYTDLLSRLHARDSVRFHTLTLDGAPVAIEMIVRFGPTLVVHKVTFDEAHAKASPGNLIWSHTLEHACADPEITSVDLLAMDELMSRWGATPYAYDTFTVFARGLVPSLITRWPAQWRARLATLRGGSDD